MYRIVIFGCGPTGRRAYKEYQNEYSVSAFMDNDPAKVGEIVYGIRVYAPSRETLQSLQYDYILIASVDGRWQIEQQLKELDVRLEQIKYYVDRSDIDVLSCFLKNLSADFLRYGMAGSCAEVGVFRGESAKKINRYFRDRTLHLYDTFEGFAEKDLEMEQNIGRKDARVGQFNDTSVELVLNEMPYPEKVVIHKGYFPDTARDLQEDFCMVRLDLDLYVPTLAALKIFSPLIISGGCILIHDYFGEAYPGIRKAVEEFLKVHSKLRKIPLGDELTIAITGF